MEYFAVFVPSLENTGKFAQQTLEITSNSSKFNEFYVKTTFLQFIRNFFPTPADPETFIFESKDEALKAVKANKESRFKSFKNHHEALKFVKIGIQAQPQQTNNKEPSNYDFLKCK